MANAQWGGPYCRNDELPIVLLHRNSTTGEFTVVKRIPSSSSSSSSTGTGTSTSIGTGTSATISTSFNGNDPAQAPSYAFDEGGFRWLQAQDIVDSTTSSTNLRQRIIPGLVITETQKENRSLQGGAGAGGEFSLTNDVALPQTNDTEKPGISNGGDGGDIGGEDNSTTSQNNGSTAGDANEELFYYARECSCFEGLYPTSYCPFTVEICQQPARFSRETHPGCLTSPPNRERSKFIFLIVIAWYWCVLAVLLFSQVGHSFFDYLISCCIPAWNRRRVDQIMQHDPQRMRLLLRSYILREQEQIMERSSAARENNFAVAVAAAQPETLSNTEDQDQDHQDQDQDNNPATNAVYGNVPPTLTTTTTAGLTTETPVGVQPEPEEETRRPTSLALRTRIYKTCVHIINSNDNNNNDNNNINDSNNNDHPSQQQEDEDEEVCCTICFAPLIDGDRVGQLPCDHAFHVECLKQWLARKNVCPLCQTKNVAMPRYNAIDEQELIVCKPTTTLTPTMETPPLTPVPSLSVPPVPPVPDFSSIDEPDDNDDDSNAND